MPRITIAGAARVFDCDAEDTVLRAGLRAGLGLPYECNVGSCGQCKFQLLEGELRPPARGFPVLSERDRDCGRYLACQAQPLSDCLIRVRAEERYVPHRVPRARSAILESIRTLTRDIRSFTFRTTTPADFLAGQYALLRLPGVAGVRPLSMANLPNAHGLWEFMIREVPGGQASAYLFGRARQGDEIRLDAAYGTAFYRTSTPGIVCIAGGSGIAPVLSIAHAAAADPDCHRLEFFYGGRTPADLCHADIRAIASRDDLRIVRHSVVSDAGVGPEWGGPRGLIHEYLTRTLAPPVAATRFYLAGPPAMVEAVVSVLVGERFGIPHDRIHYDRFF